MTILSLRDIKKHFGATPALAGVDLDLRKGDVHALIGENGGKKHVDEHSVRSLSSRQRNDVAKRQALCAGQHA